MNRRFFVKQSGALGLAAGWWQGGVREVIRPRRLREGDRVALVAPAGSVALRADVEVAEESLQALGLEVKRGANLHERYGYLAGSDEVRASDLMAQFADETVSGIVAIRGGWGCARIVPLLDFDLIRSNPKILVGYSDVTALLLGIHARTGLVTFHGPIGTGPWNRFTADYFRRVLFGAEAVLYQNPEEKGNNLTQVTDRVQTISSGTAEGPLLGGNLTVLAALVGSDYLPHWDRTILFLEDTNEYIYRIDRMLTQLGLAGVLSRISGLVFGKCTDCDPGQGYGSLTLEQVLDDHVKPLGVPAWSGSMIGHEPEKFTLPLGVDARINADRGTIQLLGPAVV